MPLAGELLPAALIGRNLAGRMDLKLSPEVSADLSFAGVSGLDGGTDATAQLSAAARIAF